MQKKARMVTNTKNWSLQVDGSLSNEHAVLRTNTGTSTGTRKRKLDECKFVKGRSTQLKVLSKNGHFVWRDFFFFFVPDEYKEGNTN
jgi:hypothetical protein